MEKRNKKMTLENIARIIQREFLDTRKEMGEQFRKVDGRFNKVEERFNKVDDDIGYVHGRLDLIEREIADIKKKLENIVYRHEFESLRDRIAKVEKKLGLRT